jgi:hypothetical protein
MEFSSPVLRAYRSCGFHNHTIAELRNDTSLLRRAVLSDDSRVAHVPNIFGCYENRGVTYDTVLTLVGIDDPLHALGNSSRGGSVMELVHVSDTSKIWEFKIVIPKQYCHEDQFVPKDGDYAKHIGFCQDLCDRTQIFAMEFLCCYKFFIEQVLETYQRGFCEIIEAPVRDNDIKDHPKEEEVQALLCPYDSIAKMLKDFQESHNLAWSEDHLQSITPFLHAHAGKNRKAMFPYYKEWLFKHRVDPSLVERKTMEFVSMQFLDQDYPD